MFIQTAHFRFSIINVPPVMNKSRDSTPDFTMLVWMQDRIQTDSMHSRGDNLLRPDGAESSPVIELSPWPHLAGLWTKIKYGLVA
jgi:hypothetical protein